MPKKIPMRRCIGCGEQREKKDLIRIVRTTEGEISLDVTGRMNGRGAYLCRDRDCLEKAWKRRSLNKAFRMPVSAETYRILSEEMEKMNAG